MDLEVGSLLGTFRILRTCRVFAHRPPLFRTLLSYPFCPHKQLRTLPLKTAAC